MGSGFRLQDSRSRGPDLAAMADEEDSQDTAWRPSAELVEPTFDAGILRQ